MLDPHSSATTSSPCARLASRGLDVTDRARSSSPRSRAQRRRLIPQLEGAQARAEHRRATKWRGPSGRASTPSPSTKRARRATQKIKQLEIELEAVERQRTLHARDAAQPAARERAGGQERRRQRRGAHVGRAASVRLRAEGALGPRARSSASSTSSAPPRSPARASRC